MEKWKGKYRIPSARASWWDYSSNGYYFITICTHNRQHFFGGCKNGNMKLTTVGALVQGFWYEIPKHFPFVTLGEFVVMPNHIHGILILNNEDVEIGQCPISKSTDEKIGQCPISKSTDEKIGHCPISKSTDEKIGQCPISTGTENNVTFAQQRFRNQGKHSVSSIVGSFKSICTKHINLVFPEINFAWQKLFWDNIIQDENAFLNISNYIVENRNNWDKDKFYPDEV